MGLGGLAGLGGLGGVCGGDVALLRKLVAYWSMEEATGATRVDSINAHNLTSNGGVTQADGRQAKAAGFASASSQYLSVADHADLSIGGDVSFAFAAWVYLDVVDAKVLIAKNSAVGGEYQLEIGTYFQFSVRNAANAAWATAAAETLTPIAVSTWYYIVCGYYADLDVVFIQVNNGVQHTEALTGGGRDGAAPMTMGANGNPAAFIDGRVDEVAFWRGRVPNPAELTWLYNAGSGRALAEVRAYQQVAHPEWGHSFYAIGEHAIISGGLVYQPQYDPFATPALGGLVVYDATTGEIAKRLLLNDGGCAAAPAIDAAGKLHLYSATGNLRRVNLSTMTVEQTLSGLTTTIDWEALTYDAANDRIFVPAANGLRAVKASDYSTVWTNTLNVSLPGGSDLQITPPLIVGDYVYMLGSGNVLSKLALSDGTNVAGLDLSAQAADSYAQLIYDADHDYIYASDTAGATVFAVDATTMALVWSKQLEAAGYTIFRGGAYHGGVLYMTARGGAPAYGSKVYALDVEDSGNILWTNTTALDNGAQISSILIDDDYLYATTFDYVDGNYARLLILNIADGTLNSTISLSTGASSNIPTAQAGVLYVGLWNRNGVQALRVRAGGGTGTFPWKADAYRTGYIGAFMSGALVAH